MPRPWDVLGLQQCLGGTLSKNIHKNTRTQAEHCRRRWSILFTSSFSGFNVLADRFMKTLLILSYHSSICFHDWNLPTLNSSEQNVFKSKPQTHSVAPTWCPTVKETVYREANVWSWWWIWNLANIMKCVILLMLQHRGLTQPSSNVSLSFSFSLSLDTGPVEAPDLYLIPRYLLVSTIKVRTNKH